MLKPSLSYVAECQIMTEKVELLLLANKCRSLATQADDESTVRSLNRLADDYETRAKVVEHLRNCARTSGPGTHSRGARRAES
jgi:hypothetical protein